MNEGIIRIGEFTSAIIQAEIWIGSAAPLNDNIFFTAGSQQIFFGPYGGGGPGPTIPMAPIAGNPRMYEITDIRTFEVTDNRIFEA